MERALEEQQRNCYCKTQPSRLKRGSRGKLEEEDGRRPEPHGVVPQLHCSAAPSAWPGGCPSRPPQCTQQRASGPPRTPSLHKARCTPPRHSLPRRVRWPPGDDERGTRRVVVSLLLAAAPFDGKGLVRLRSDDDRKIVKFSGGDALASADTNGPHPHNQR